MTATFEENDLDKITLPKEQAKTFITDGLASPFFTYEMENVKKGTKQITGNLSFVRVTDDEKLTISETNTEIVARKALQDQDNQAESKKIYGFYVSLKNFDENIKICIVRSAKCDREFEQNSKVLIF